MIALAVITFAVCGNNKTGSVNITTPPDNNATANPSVADTTYSKNNADSVKKDFSKMKH
ncbi:MAG TPA: hypothetical protein VKI61_13490 [Chitinophagaceae bacterium]|nr:hypothetical protein [Chitinophagaceae bacterium]